MFAFSSGHKHSICVWALAVTTVNYAINAWFKNACGRILSGGTKKKKEMYSDRTTVKSALKKNQSSDYRRKPCILLSESYSHITFLKMDPNTAILN